MHLYLATVGKLVCSFFIPMFNVSLVGFILLLKREGLRGLYAGIGPTMLGILPYAGISFATFETLKPVLSDEGRRVWEEGENGRRSDKREHSLNTDTAHLFYSRLAFFGPQAISRMTSDGHILW